MSLIETLATGYFNIDVECKYECCRSSRNNNIVVMYYWNQVDKMK